MSAIVNNAAEVLPPIISNAADATSATGVLRVAATTSSTAVTIPQGMRGKWVSVLARGADTQWGVVMDGATAPTLVYDQAAAFGTGHAAAGWTTLSNTREQVVLPVNAKQIVYICANATAGNYVEFRVSSGKAR